MARQQVVHLWLLVDPFSLAVLVRDDLALFEPESNLLLGVLDAVGAVADIATDVLFLRLALGSTVCWGERPTMA